ncbi:hypothetical protein I3760_13G063300 [Carya illinoinensis]|nr:hypothetical protein I3760_13G063300 [Carya illinoinensis]
MDPTITIKRTDSSPLEMHQPGIEPGSVPWQGTILPLDHCYKSGRTWLFKSRLIKLSLIKAVCSGTNAPLAIRTPFIVKIWLQKAVCLR